MGTKGTSISILIVKTLLIYVAMACREYTDYLEEISPGLGEAEIHLEIEKHFPSWFQQFVMVDGFQNNYKFQVDFVNNNDTMDDLLDLSDPNCVLDHLPVDDEAFDVAEPEFETDGEEDSDLEDSD
ncbi:hypothetical protein M5689_000590 [Euphorbia peplus]|nr:hypothetical protein M5689_000590 [Euphorbia peplus]